MFSDSQPRTLKQQNEKEDLAKCECHFGLAIISCVSQKNTVCVVECIYICSESSAATHHHSEIDTHFFGMR